MNSNPNSGASLERKLLKGVERLMRGVGPSLMRSPILVAVSGGPDSLALLLLLNRLREPLGLTLHAAHLNHGLRGADAESDAQFVKDTANSLGLPATLGAEDVKSYAAGRGLSPEEAAREARYAFLATVAAEHGAASAALGHTADDQAETVLMHVLRGSGLTGLAGMSALSYRPAAQGGERVALLRPLLDATREETAAYCRWRGFAPRDDATNRSLEFTRNKIRLELLPFLSSYNPRIREALLRLSAAAAHDQDYIVGEAVQAFGKLAAADGGGIRIEREGFASLHPALKRHLLRLAYREVTGSTDGLEHSHIEDMVKLSDGAAGRRVDLPDGIVFSTGYDSLSLTMNAVGASGPPALRGEHPLRVPGQTRIPGWSVTARLLPYGGEPPNAGAYTATLDAKRVGQALCVRGRRPGDRFTPLGMTGSRKLQDFMVDARIPSDLRDGAPLVVSEEGIVWIVGHRIAHWARVTEETDEILSLEFAPADAT